MNMKKTYISPETRTYHILPQTLLADSSSTDYDQTGVIGTGLAKSGTFFIDEDEEGDRALWD